MCAHSVAKRERWAALLRGVSPLHEELEASAASGPWLPRVRAQLGRIPILPDQVLELILARSASPTVSMTAHDVELRRCRRAPVGAPEDDHSWSNYTFNVDRFTTS